MNENPGYNCEVCGAPIEREPVDALDPESPMQVWPCTCEQEIRHLDEEYNQ